MVRNRCIDYMRKKKLSQNPTHYLQNNKDDSEYFDELAFAEMMRQIINAIEI
jgi:hypothetical protein